ncbi:MAG: alpha/beta hydrolase-fold protein [Bellilinea sp.]
MNAIPEPQVLLYNNWIVRIHPARQKDARIMLMLHGWTGDENSMLVFQRELPDNFWVIAPRGTIETPEGGYGWIGHRPGKEATLDAFRHPAQALDRLLTTLRADYSLGNESLCLMGFSQGAALSLTFAFLYPQQVRKVAVLAGFMPYLMDTYQPAQELGQIQFFIAHGTQDEIVPIERANELASFLEQHKAQVQFCQSPVSHRISANCFKRLGLFFRD